MAKYSIDSDTLYDMADAIREQTGKSALLPPSAYASEIRSIPAGGGECAPTQEKNVVVTENGTVEITPDEGYVLSKVTAYVDVPSNVDGSTNTEWFANLITNDAVEIYNDKARGTLAAYAFYEKDGVTRVELPNIEYLKERCFYNCANLKTLLLPSLVGYTYQYMASGCSKLVDVDIHGTSYVSSYTFQNCTSLKKVELHRVGTIGTNAFVGATKFETLIIRTDSVPTLGGTNAFTNTKIKSGGTGYIYVKPHLVEEFKKATNWSSFASQIRAIEGESAGGKLPTPTLMLEWYEGQQELYLSDYGNATRATYYASYINNGDWVEVATRDLIPDSQETTLVEQLLDWVTSNGFVGSAYFSVICHADGYEDSERVVSNEFVF